MANSDKTTIVPFRKPEKGGGHSAPRAELDLHIQAALDRGRQEFCSQIMAYIAPRFGLSRAYLLSAPDPDSRGEEVHLMLDMESGDIVQKWSDAEWQQIVHEWSRRARPGLKQD